MNHFCIGCEQLQQSLARQTANQSEENQTETVTTDSLAQIEAYLQADDHQNVSGLTWFLYGD